MLAFDLISWRILLGRLLAALVVGALSWCLPMVAHAHKASDAYLTLSQQGETISLRWDVALRDLDAVTPLDSNDDGRLSWGEIKAHQVEIEAYLLSRWGMRAVDADGRVDRQADQGCTFKPERAADGPPGPALERRIDGTYYVLKLRADCPSPTGRYAVRYGLMQGVDPTHRGLLQVPGRQAALVPLTPGDEELPLALVASTQASPLVQLWRDGIHHILIGSDHLLFLLCLLLPAVLRPEASSGKDRRGWRPVHHWRDALGPVVMTVSMFTLAHSITLALATLQLLTLPPRLIEPAIALTIGLAALDNLYPIFRGRRHLFTFLFGLVHGFGFAGVLMEMNLPLGGFAQALLAFNLGVETGQLLVVLPAMALLLALRRWSWYGPGLVPAGSLAAMAVAAGWFVERVFDLGFMPL